MRALAVAAAVSVLALTAAEPAAAVQTSSYKLAATGPRTKLVHGYGSGAVHDTFVVGNLTGRPLTLVLDVVSASLQSNTDYALGQPGQGFAAKVHIGEQQVTLKPHEQRTLPVVIDRPARTSQPLYAAITLLPKSAPSGGIGVQMRLALLVEITPTPEKVEGTSTATSVARILAVIVAVGLVLGLILLFVRRRKRDGATA